MQIVKDLIAEINQYPLKIEPMGVFEVSPRLIPTVIHPVDLLKTISICFKTVFQYIDHQWIGYDSICLDELVTFVVTSPSLTCYKANAIVIMRH